MLYDWTTHRAENVVKYIIEPHGRHIEIIRTYVDSANTSEEEVASYSARVAGIIAQCHNLKSLGLYYNSWPSDVKAINKEILSLLENNRLNSLGIYSTVILDDRWAPSLEQRGYCGPMEIIHRIGTSEKASLALKNLDIATEWMPKETYDLLRSNTFANLESFTVRYSFRYEELWINDPIERTKWCPSTKLVRLQLLNCQTAYSPDIPLIVKQLDSLRELLVSTCGYRADFIPPPRAHGWSRQPAALCRTRRPLNLLSLEHMGGWEIKELGVIPATTLICSNVRRRDLLEAFDEDPEIFPGVELLRVLPDRLVVPMEEEEPTSPEPVIDVDGNAAPTEEVETNGEVPEEEAFTDEVDAEVSQDEVEDETLQEEQRIQALIADTSKRLDRICAERQIELRRDAPRQMRCYCCSY